jgi:hypothetical protein
MVLYHNTFSISKKFLTQSRFSAYEVVSSFTNTESSLVDQPMIPFQKAYAMIVFQMVLILVGNCAYVSTLRSGLVEIAYLIFTAYSVVGYQLLLIQFKCLRAFVTEVCDFWCAQLPFPSHSWPRPDIWGLDGLLRRWSQDIHGWMRRALPPWSPASMLHISLLFSYSMFFIHHDFSTHVCSVITLWNQTKLSHWHMTCMLLCLSSWMTCAQISSFSSTLPPEQVSGIANARRCHQVISVPNPVQVVSLFP